jgi:hypothetical protein
MAALAFSFSRSLIDLTAVVPAGVLDEPRDIVQRSSKLPEGFAGAADGAGDVTLDRIIGEGVETGAADIRDVCWVLLGDNTPIPIPKPVLLVTGAVGCCEYNGVEA